MTVSKPVDKRVKALRRFAFSITFLTVVGQTLLGFEQAWIQPLVSLASSLAFAALFELIDAWAGRRRPALLGSRDQLVTFFLPAWIAGMAIGLLLYPGDRLLPFVFATAISAGGKYLFRAPVAGRMRHVMNPSNLGIAATLVLFSWVGVGLPYMFTENVGGALDWIIPAVLLASGLFLNGKLTGRLPLIAAWLVGFAAQAVIRGLTTGVSIPAALAPMTGVAFLLFTNYMITDPGTSPQRPRNQVIFALTAAAAYGVFTALHLVYGLFLCVLVACALRGIVLWVVHWLPERAPGAAAAVPAPARPRPQTVA
jgi:hypothetical protein